MAAEPLLRIDGLTKRFGGLVANDDVSLTVEEGETRAVIGPNGAGKTTFLTQIAGELAPDAGSIRFAGQDVTGWNAARRARGGMIRSYQITRIMPSLSLFENAALAAAARGGGWRHPWQPLAAGRAAREDAEAALARVGLGARAGDPAFALSHGERRQLEMAIAIAARPRLLLLDEPTAGMGPEESAAMRRLIAALKQDHTILLVEHDMDIVFSVADRITVLVSGRAAFTGTPDEARASATVRAAYLGDGTASKFEL